MAGLKMRIGIFGGTFDPPHIGHLILASETRNQLNLDRLLWVLTPTPPHKKYRQITPVDIRLELVQAAIKDNPEFELSRIEIERPGPHYAVDTVRLLSDIYPGDDLVYLIGGDSLHDLPTWYHAGEFVKACSQIGVMRRPGDSIDFIEIQEKLPEIESRISIVTAPLLEISASEIRLRIANGKPFRYYLPDAVYRLIIENHYYFTNK
jgi:nicotinate-nucleotide adenylyltransferase